MGMLAVIRVQCMELPQEKQGTARNTTVIPEKKGLICLDDKYRYPLPKL